LVGWKSNNENYSSNVVHGLRTKHTSSFKDIMSGNNSSEAHPMDYYRKDGYEGQRHPNDLPKETQEPDYRFGKTSNSKLKREYIAERESLQWVREV
jgi:hypothetical protein